MCSIICPQILVSLLWIFFFNSPSRSQISVNAFCGHTVVLYYLWLLLLSVFIAIIRQQALWQSQPAICRYSPWLKELERTLKASYPKLQIGYGKNDAILPQEPVRSEAGGGQEVIKIWHCFQTLEARKSIRDEKGMGVTADPESKDFKGCLHPEQKQSVPFLTANSKIRYAKESLFLFQGQKQLQLLDPNLAFTVPNPRLPCDSETNKGRPHLVKNITAQAERHRVRHGN